MFIILNEKKKYMVYYKMNSNNIVYCVVAFLLGMLLMNMLKNVCVCKTVEGSGGERGVLAWFADLSSGIRERTTKTSSFRGEVANAEIGPDPETVQDIKDAKGCGQTFQALSGGYIKPCD